MGVAARHREPTLLARDAALHYPEVIDRLTAVHHPGCVERFDVVVVGARCAGSPLAVMLARRGLRVCVLDRARFPSETLSTHVIQPCGVVILKRLGLLAATIAAGAVPGRDLRSWPRMHASTLSWTERSRVMEPRGYVYVE